MKTEMWERLSDATEWLCKASGFVVMASTVAILAAGLATVWMFFCHTDLAFRVASCLLVCGSAGFLVGIAGVFCFMRIHEWTFDKFIDSWTEAVGEAPEVVEY